MDRELHPGTQGNNALSNHTVARHKTELTDQQWKVHLQCLAHPLPIMGEMMMMTEETIITILIEELDTALPLPKEGKDLNVKPAIGSLPPQVIGPGTT